MIFRVRRLLCYTIALALVCAAGCQSDDAHYEEVRAFLEENVPDDHALEERRMFGMVMWLVRGNMFVGVGNTSGRLLVRVGEPHVQSLLDAHPCSWLW